MDRKELISLLKQYNDIEVKQFVSYIVRLDTEKKDGVLKNAFMAYASNEKLADLFKVVNKQGLTFDGRHITYSATGVSYDYIAYKNKMLITYPETVMDVQLVYIGDSFNFSKESGKVIYSHLINNPFAQSEKEIIGGYCVVKNRRGEALTILTRDDIEKHRKIAKTKAIWDAWLKEMFLKTIVKKAVKVHFEDVFTEILELDNEENDLSLAAPENSETLTEIKAKIDACLKVDDLKAYWDSIPVKTKAINDMVMSKKKTLTANDSAN